MISVVCVMTAPSTSYSPISLPLLGPPYSLRYKDIEIRPINNLAMTLKCSSQRKSHTSLIFFIYLFLNIYLFIWLFWVFVAACALLVAAHRLLFSCDARVPEHVGSVVCGTRALWLRCSSSVVVAHRLSCPTAREILVPQPGIERASPALEGRFFTTGPPGKSPSLILNQKLEMIKLSEEGMSKAEIS